MGDGAGAPWPPEAPTWVALDFGGPLQAAWVDGAEAPELAALLPRLRTLSFLGHPHATLCCCRSRSCHSCRVSGRRLSSPAGSSRLLLGAFPTSPATRLNSEGSCSLAALCSSSSPGTWLSIKSICSRSPSPEPSSLRCRGPRGSRASSEMRNDSSEKSSVDSFPDHLLLPLSTLWKPESRPPSYRRPGNKSSAGQGLKLGGREGTRSPRAAPRRPASVIKYLKM